MTTTLNNHGDIILYPVKTLKPTKDAIKGLTHILEASASTGKRH
jgi:hypothetical protein